MLARAKYVLPLLSEALRFGKHQLSGRRVLYPTGFYTTRSGDVRLAGGWNGAAQPEVRERLIAIEESFAAQIAAGDAVAIALVADIVTPEHCRCHYPDAIRVLIEAAGYARQFYLPYAAEDTSSRQDGTALVFGEITSLEVPGRYFPSEVAKQQS
ncbi:MAG: hypothetical protein OSA97_07200 [Nevskia sp.]|nr:hypothetical protein [Nevskia sp.]